MIKYVVLDVYNLVHVRNSKFVPALIQNIAEATNYPWEECAYAFAEATNHFRNLDPNGAFLCNPRDFIEVLIEKLGPTKYDLGELYIDFVMLTTMYPPSVPDGTIDAVQYLNDHVIPVAFAANTNIIPLSSIAGLAANTFGLAAVDYGLIVDEAAHIQMPHDGAWLRIIDLARQVDSTISPSEILFVTLNGKYAIAAERAGLQIAVISSPDEMLYAIKRRLNPVVIETQTRTQNAILG